MNIGDTYRAALPLYDPISVSYDSRLTSLFASPELSGATVKIGARVGETLLDVAMRAGLPVGLLENQDVSMPLNARMLPGEVVTLTVGPSSIDAVSVENTGLSNPQANATNGSKILDPFANVDWRINLQTNRSPQLHMDNAVEAAATQDFGRGLQALSDYLDIDAYSLSGSLEIDGNTVPVSY